ncbi:MAG: hypothetical protein RI933_258, partial [Actinomycetota bacterium]|jgi:hypothetical protein
LTSVTAVAATVAVTVVHAVVHVVLTVATVATAVGAAAIEASRVAVHAAKALAVANVRAHAPNLVNSITKKSALAPRSAVLLGCRKPKTAGFGREQSKEEIQRVFHAD